MSSILIVDDEPGIRETLRLVLGDEGYDTEAVASGEECLRAFEKRDFDLVLLDVWLPGVDGLETLRRERPDVLVSDIGMPERDGYSFVAEIRKLPKEEGGATPAIAHSTGSVTCESEDSWPLRASRLISSATSRKKIAISPSLIHSSSGLAIFNPPSCTATGRLRKAS